MASTYEVTKTSDEEFITEIYTKTERRAYNKQWLIDEIERLQVILSQFPKD